MILTTPIRPASIAIACSATIACLSAVACVTTLPEGAPCTAYLREAAEIANQESDIDRDWSAYLAAVARLRAAMMTGGASTEIALGAWADARDDLRLSLLRFRGQYQRLGRLQPSPETRDLHVHAILTSSAGVDLAALLSAHVADHESLVERSLSAETTPADEWRELSIYVDRHALSGAIYRVETHVRDMVTHIAHAGRACRESA